MSRKRDRKAAARAEAERRSSERAASAPMAFEQFLALQDFVSFQAYEHGRDWLTMDLTEEWCDGNAVSFAELSDFLGSLGISSDFEVLVNADPFQLFGPRDGRTRRMPLEEEDLESLLDHLSSHIGECDKKYTLTEAWLVERGMAPPHVIGALLAAGAGCDCEVLDNCDPGQFFGG